MEHICFRGMRFRPGVFNLGRRSQLSPFRSHTRMPFLNDVTS